MRKLFVILSILIAAQSCFGIGNLTLSADLADDLGTIANPLNVGDIIDVYVEVDSEFMKIDVLFTIAGNIEFVTASGLSDSATTNNASVFGWSIVNDSDIEGPSYDPIWAIDGQTVEMGLAVSMEPKLAGRAALVQLKVTGQGDLTITINQGISFPYAATTYIISSAVDEILVGDYNDSTVLYSVPEPATVAILVLGIIPAITKRKK
jgi:hypothetical protein